jgi:FkbM family methyltransferase
VLEQLKFLAAKPQFRDAPVRTVMRLGAWRVHCLLSQGATIELASTPLRMALPPHWHGHPKLLYAFGWKFDEELPFLATRLRKGDTVFDIGANIGTWSLILSHAVGAAGRVFAYEPARATFDALSDNITLNATPNIVASRCAVSDARGTLRLYHDVDASRNSLGRTRTLNGGDFEEVPAVTLDALASELAIGALDFIKIDVEGAEPLAFAGGRATIERFTPVILFEVAPTALEALGFPYDASWRILADLGYEFYRLESGALQRVPDCPVDGGNFWAIHVLSRDARARFDVPDVG